MDISNSKTDGLSVYRPILLNSSFLFHKSEKAYTLNINDQNIN
jgi:hypothetical protein